MAVGKGDPFQQLDRTFGGPKPLSGPVARALQDAQSGGGDGQVVVVQQTQPLDRPTLGGANDSDFGNTDGTTPVEIVAAPSADTYRVVYMVHVVNTTGGAIQPIIKVSGPTGGPYRVHQAPTAGTAAGDTYLVTWEGGFVLRPTFSLTIQLAGAGAVPWGAHWADPAH